MSLQPSVASGLHRLNAPADDQPDDIAVESLAATAAALFGPDLADSLQVEPCPCGHHWLYHNDAWSHAMDSLVIGGGPCQQCDCTGVTARQTSEESAA